MKDEKVIDLVASKDGTYSPKNMPVKVESKPKPQKPKVQKPVNHLDEFFGGMDLGLDFVEGMTKRAKRMLKLRNM